MKLLNKEILKIIDIMCLILLLSTSSIGCSKKEKEDNSIPPKESEQIEEDDNPSYEVKYKNGNIDYDLTSMGSDMIYSTVYQIVTDPKEFENKTIRIYGTYDSVYFEPEKKYYHYCVIKDAMQCCEQGMEFEVKKGNYPKKGTNIVITGKLKTYKEKDDKTTFCKIVNANLKVK